LESVTPEHLFRYLTGNGPHEQTILRISSTVEVSSSLLIGIICANLPYCGCDYAMVPVKEGHLTIFLLGVETLDTYNANSEVEIGQKISHVVLLHSCERPHFWIHSMPSDKYKF
jgi:hypothetical protein